PSTGSGNITYRIGTSAPNTQTDVVFFYTDGVLIEPNTSLDFPYFDSTTEAQYYPYKTTNDVFSGYHRQIAEVGETNIVTDMEGTFENRAICARPMGQSPYDDTVNRKTYDALDIRISIQNKIPITPGDEYQLM